MPDGAAYQAESVIEFAATDIGATWLAEVGWWSAAGGGFRPRVVRAKAGEPTGFVNAPVEDLALWAWTRGASSRSRVNAQRSALCRPC
jgi:hypothetical protein